MFNFRLKRVVLICFSFLFATFVCHAMESEVVGAEQETRIEIVEPDEDCKFEQGLKEKSGQEVKIDVEVLCKKDNKIETKFANC